MVHELVRHLRQRGVVAHVRPIGEDVGEEVDELGHAARELVELRRFIRRKRPAALDEAVSQLRESGQCVGEVQENLCGGKGERK